MTKPSTPKKLKKNHRLCGYFNQLEVYDLKLYVKKNPKLKSMSDFIRKALFTYKSGDKLMLEKILSEIKRIKNSGGVVHSKDQEMWEDYKKQKEEVFEENNTNISPFELHRRKVMDEMKKVFAQDKKGNLCEPPEEEMKEIEHAREERLQQISENYKNKK